MKKLVPDPPRTATQRVRNLEHDLANQQIRQKLSVQPADASLIADSTGIRPPIP